MTQYYTAKKLKMGDSLQLKTSLEYSQDFYSSVPKSTNFSQRQFSERKGRFMAETNCDTKMKQMVNQCINQYMSQAETDCASSTDINKCLSEQQSLIQTRCNENATPPSVFSKGSLNKYGFVCSQKDTGECDCEAISCTPENFTDGSCTQYSIEGCKKCQTDCINCSSSNIPAPSPSNLTSTSSSNIPMPSTPNPVDNKIQSSNLVYYIVIIIVVLLIIALVVYYQYK